MEESELLANSHSLGTGCCVEENCDLDRMELQFTFVFKFDITNFSFTKPYPTQIDYLYFLKVNNLLKWSLSVVMRLFLSLSSMTGSSACVVQRSWRLHVETEWVVKYHLILEVCENLYARCPFYRLSAICLFISYI